MTLYDLFIFYGIIGLFIFSIISSIIPVPTEPVVFGLLVIGGNARLVFIALTSGSIFGSYIAYFMGKYGLELFNFKIKKNKNTRIFRRYAIFFIFISPIAAGIQNYDLKRFSIMIVITNILKSIVIVYFSVTAISWWKLLASYEIGKII